MNRNRLGLVILGLASFGIANPVLAGDNDSRIVSYADLDLTTPAGQATLDGRLQAAVRQVCGRAFPRDLHSVKAVRNCRADTLSGVQAQRNDALAQAYNHRVQLSAR